MFKHVTMSVQKSYKIHKCMTIFLTPYALSYVLQHHLTDNICSFFMCT